MTVTEHKISGSKLAVGFKRLSVPEEEIMRFHPKFKPLLDEIVSHGWKYSFENAEGAAVAEVDLDQVSFRYWYHPPRIEEMEKEGEYRLEVSLGSKPPANIIIKSIERFRINISTEHSWHAATIDPFTSRVTHLENPFWGGFISRNERPKKLSQARELYNLARWLFQEKGMEPADKYVTEHYKELLDRFGQDVYRFPLRLELTVEDEEKVPSYEKLLDGLSQHLRKRGLLMELEKKPDFFDRKKPIP